MLETVVLDKLPQPDHVAREPVSRAAHWVAQIVGGEHPLRWNAMCVQVVPDNKPIVFWAWHNPLKDIPSKIYERDDSSRLRFFWSQGNSILLMF